MLLLKTGAPIPPKPTPKTGKAILTPASHPLRAELRRKKQGTSSAELGVRSAPLGRSKSQGPISFRWPSAATIHQHLGRVRQRRDRGPGRVSAQQAAGCGALDFGVVLDAWR